MKNLITLTVVFIFFGSVFSVNASAIGELERIMIGGSKLSVDSPVYRSILKTSARGGFTYCSAVLIASKFALTAAHCALGGGGSRGSEISALPITEKGCSAGHVVEAIFAPDAKLVKDDEGKINFYPDIALLKLDHELCGSKPMPIVDSLEFKDGSDFFAAGFGKGNQNKDEAEEIALVKIASNHQVIFDELDLPPGTVDEKYSKEVDEIIKYDYFSVPKVAQTSACGGDSGGPAYVKRGNSVNLLGITSMKLSSPKGTQECEYGYINAFTKLFPNLKWIREKMKE